MRDVGALSLSLTVVLTAAVMWSRSLNRIPRKIHEVVNESFDHEEAVARPLILTHYTATMMVRDRRKALGEVGRRRIALVFGWVASFRVRAGPQSTSEAQRLAQRYFRALS